jgi:hypothetical protein
MDQKHAVEDVLLDAGLPGLMLEATMFMEEFWKRYTRPGLLKGSFTFSLPGGARGTGAASVHHNQQQQWVKMPEGAAGPGNSSLTTSGVPTAAMVHKLCCR